MALRRFHSFLLLNDVELNELPLSCMLYADDLVIFSKSKNGLQDYLDSLSEYCKENDLSVNLSKTKVLIFNNCGRIMNKHVLYYRGSKLNNVSNYKYLGLQFSTYGTFTYAKQEIKKVALKLCTNSGRKWATISETMYSSQ